MFRTFCCAVLSHISSLFYRPVSKMAETHQPTFILKPLNENIKNSLLHKRRAKFLILKNAPKRNYNIL